MTEKTISERAIEARGERTLTDQLEDLAVMCDTLARVQEQFATVAGARAKHIYHKDLAGRLRIEAANLRLRAGRTNNGRNQR
jgi:hypothetical protein